MIHISNSSLNYCLPVFLVFPILLFTGCREPDAGNIEPNPVVLVNTDDSEEEILMKATQVRPSERQLEWQKKEFLAFIHFNLFAQNPDGEIFTMETFNPEEFDADQWVEVCKNLGMKMVILTAKHHRGFCLWPSEYTEYSVKNSPWRDGQKVEGFILEAQNAGEWNTFTEGTTIGYKRLLRFDDITTDKVRLRITGSRAAPELNNFGLYYQPPVE